MLSNHERKALRELERQFTPEPNPRDTDPLRRRNVGAAGTWLITTALLLAVLMLLAGSLTGALVFGIVTWLWWAWLPSIATRGNHGDRPSLRSS